MEKFMKEIKEMHKKVKTTLKKLQENIKKYVNKNRKEIVKYKVENRILLNTKDLVQQIRDRKTKKLIEKSVKLYKIKKISENIVELKLLVFMKIYLVVNMSRITIYQKQVEEQKNILLYPVEINKEKKYIRAIGQSLQSYIRIIIFRKS